MMSFPIQCQWDHLVYLPMHRLTCRLRTDIESFLESAESGEPSFPARDLVLGMRKVKNRSRGQWQYSVHCVRSPE